MGQSAQNSNPWGGYSRGPAGTVGPGSGVSPGGPSITQPGSIDPRFTNGGYNPNGNVNPWSGFGNRGAGGGTTAPGSGVSPGGPQITQPGSIDPGFTGETGGATPYTPPQNPTLQTGGMTPFQTIQPQPGSMNQQTGGMTPYVGQQAPTNSGPGQFYGQRNGPVHSGQGQFYGQRNGQIGPGVPGGPPGGPRNGYQPLGMGQLPNAQTDDAGYVKSLYSGLLGRDPSADEVSNASQALTGQYGGNRDALANFFKGSDEFKAKAPNAYGGPGSGAPYDPRTPGYQPGAGWQTMLRQYAMTDGRAPNQYVQDRGLSPMWGDQRQSWEPNAPPAGMGLSELLRQYRGY